MLGSLPTADNASPVATLSAVSIVSKSLHELTHDGCHAFRVVATGDRFVGETVARDGCGDDVKSVVGTPSVRCRISQWADDLMKLHEGTRPTVGNDQW